MGKPVELQAPDKGPAKIRLALVGGKGGFIAYHHDTGIHLATQANERSGSDPYVAFEVVASALHQDAETSIAAGERREIIRPYGSYQELIAGEAKKRLDERAVAASIRLPNDQQHKAVKAFLEAGYHIIVDKPNATRPSEANEQWKLAKDNDLVSAMTFSYWGSPMVKEMAYRVAKDGPNSLTHIIGMYPQGWTIGLPKNENFRLQYKTSGGIGVAFDLGATHTLTDMEAVSGLSIQKINATLRTFPNHEDLAKCSEVDNFGQALLLFGDGGNITVPGTAYWSQVATGRGNDHSLQVEGQKNTYIWQNSVIPGPGPEALVILESNGSYRIIPRDPNTPRLLQSPAALRACKGPVAHGEGLDHWFKANYRDFGDLVAEAVYGITAPEEARAVRTLEHGAKSLFYAFKLAESHAKHGPVKSIFNPYEIPDLERFVNEHYLAKISPGK